MQAKPNPPRAPKHVADAPAGEAKGALPGGVVVPFPISRARPADADVPDADVPDADVPDAGVPDAGDLGAVLAALNDTGHGRASFYALRCRTNLSPEDLRGRVAALERGGFVVLEERRDGSENLRTVVLTGAGRGMLVDRERTRRG